MKLLSIISTQVIRALRINAPIGGIPIPEVIKFIQDRYRFVVAPASLQEWDLNKGATFDEGVFAISDSKNIVINALQIFTNGVVATTTAQAEDVDLFIDDLLNAANQSYGVEINSYFPIVARYTSEVEVQLNLDISQFYSPLANKLSEKIGYVGEGYDDNKPNFSPASLVMVPSKTLHPFPLKSFIIERREGFPVENQVYYSNAPFSTRDHLEILTSLEEPAGS